MANFKRLLILLFCIVYFFVLLGLQSFFSICTLYMQLQAVRSVTISYKLYRLVHG